MDSSLIDHSIRGSWNTHASRRKPFVGLYGDVEWAVNNQLVRRVKNFRTQESVFVCENMFC